MAWTSYDLGAQWFDVSLQNNGWVWGTFVGAGPIASGQNTFTWDGFLPNARHYLRVNTLTSNGWYESQTATFLTRSCGNVAPVNKNGPHCDGSWCSGDPAPPQCQANDYVSSTGARGCIWVNRVNNPTTEPVELLNGPDDGNGDCIHGTAGQVGQRRVTLYMSPSQQSFLAFADWAIRNP
jgi:hypothetical protein